MDGQESQDRARDPRRAPVRRRRRPRQRTRDHQAPRQRVHRHPGDGAGHARDTSRASYRARSSGVPERLPGPRIRELRARSRSRSSSSSRSSRVAWFLLRYTPLRQPPLRRRRRRGGREALRRAHPPGDDQAPTCSARRGGDHRPVHRQPARRRQPDGRDRGRLRPRVDRRRRAGWHLSARRPRRRPRHAGRRLHPRDARQHVQPARGQRVRQGRRPRGDHHRRGRRLLGPLDAPAPWGGAGRRPGRRPAPSPRWEVRDERRRPRSRSRPPASDERPAVARDGPGRAARDPGRLACS